MRNGNRSWATCKPWVSSVQSNLWGMETNQNTSQAPQDNRFNRIYEEWKRDGLLIDGFFRVAFNRIYEEWKPANDFRVTNVFDCSIESMRNGNIGTPSIHPWISRVQSNLWGMETVTGSKRSDCDNVFNRIYEEWKQKQTHDSISVCK